MIQWIQQIECLKSISYHMRTFFTYNSLWRINREPSDSNKCDFWASVLLILMVAAYFISRTVVMFQRSQLELKITTQIADLPQKSTITTLTNQEDLQPFMLAFDLYSANNNPDLTDLTITNYTESRNPQTSAVNDNNFILEQCTKQHFKNFPQIDNRFDKWGASNWLCLPLNKTFELEGSWTLSKGYSSIDLVFNCTGACMTNNPSGLNIRAYALNTILNPSNKTSPEEFNMDHYILHIEPNTHQEYFIQLNENLLKTDNSLIFWNSWTTTKSWEIDNFQQNIIRYNQAQSSTHFYIQRSEKTIITERSYMKITKLMADVGGFFSSIFIFFFFMGNVSEYLFEMKIAKKLFGTKEVNGVGFKGWLQNCIYRLLSCVKCLQPSWDNAKKHQEIRTTVSRILDITYLQKRIDFLESAIHLLLQNKEYVELYLHHQMRKQDADKKYYAYLLQNMILKKKKEAAQERKETTGQREEEGIDEDELYSVFDRKTAQQVIQALEKRSIPQEGQPERNMQLDNSRRNIMQEIIGQQQEKNNKILPQKRQISIKQLGKLRRTFIQQAHRYVLKKFQKTNDNKDERNRESESQPNYKDQRVNIKNSRPVKLDSMEREKKESNLNGAQLRQKGSSGGVGIQNQKSSQILHHTSPLQREQ